MGTMDLLGALLIQWDEEGETVESGILVKRGSGANVSDDLLWELRHKYSKRQKPLDECGAIPEISSEL